MIFIQLPDGYKNVTVRGEKIILTVAHYYSRTVAEIKMKSRRRRSVFPRYMTFYFLRNHSDMTTGDIARLFKLDHSTIIYGVNQIYDQAQVYPRVQSDINQLNIKIEQL